MGSLLLTMSWLGLFAVFYICSPCMGQIRTSDQLQNQVTNLVGVIANLQTATRNLQRTTNEATNSGTLTPPKEGYYHICAYSRFQNSGNAVEMCIRKGTQRIACYGNAVQYDWRSTGACTNVLLATTDTVSLYLESGGSQDCVQETGWLYNRISIQLIQQTAA